MWSYIYMQKGVFVNAHRFRQRAINNKNGGHVCLVLVIFLLSRW